jgi:PAS domain S-box-containing protein
MRYGITAGAESERHMNQHKNSSSVSILDRPLRVLHVEDSVDDRTIIQTWITGQNIAAEFIDVDNERDFRRILDTHDVDIILADKSVPGFDGLQALHYAREHRPDIPFIFVTGSIGEDAAIETIKDGATDYVLKDRLNRLIPAVHRAIREAEQEERNRAAELKLRRQAALLDKSQDGIMVRDMEDRIQYWNKSAAQMYGWAAGDVLGRKAASLLTVQAERYEEAEGQLMATGNWRGELVKQNRGGNQLIVDSRWTLVRDEKGNPECVLVIDTDITEKKSIEAKLLRSQRLDSLGALAGGIAHDLNNALAPVLMGAELLAACESVNDRQRYLDIVLSNTRRATSLVKQILSFARGTGNRDEPVQVRRLIGELVKMIQETFPKSIALTVKLPQTELWSVRGDTTEIHQILLNLCVNARDAMPKGGQLVIAVENTIMDVASAAATGTNPGPYVMISVTDTGTGIPPEVLPRIFEPFFTTKLDKGTGLGLSTVSTIVKHHGGFLDIQTEAGKGTTFKVRLPAIVASPASAAEAKDVSVPMGLGELVLVIDDEETLLELTKTMLESSGYVVISAANGVQGLARFRENVREIKLVVTDSDMPFMDGMATIRSIKDLAPDVPVILASGTKNDTEEVRRATTVQRLYSLAKPFSLSQLLKSVDLALQRDGSQEPAAK